MAEDLKKKMKEEAAQFFTTIKDFGYCKVLELKTIVVKSKCGEWACIGLFGIFKTKHSPSQRTTIFESEDIFIEEQFVDVENLQGIIDYLIETKVVDTKVGKVKFGGPEAMLTNLRFNNNSGYVQYQNEQFGSVGLEGYANVEGELYDSGILELQLQSREEPYEDLGDLTLEKIGERLEPARPPSIGIRAPRYMRLDVTFEEDELIVHLVAHKKMNLSDFKLTAIIRGEQEYPALNRLEIPLISPELHKDDLVKVIHKQDVKDASFARIFLFQQIEGRFTRMDIEHASKIASRMPRSLIHQYFDPDLGILENWATGGGKDPSTDFEWAISLLLSTLGFSAEWIGFDFEKASSILLRKSSGVDIIAFTPDNSVVILGQCTTTKPPSEKVGPLKITSNELKNKLKDSSVLDIIPTIFTLLDENSIKDEIEKLRKENIVVVGIQSIEKLLTDVKIGVKLEDILINIFNRPRIAIF